ncbi:MAG: lipopolysaccharide biosynthesis protein [Solirubrobacterales bacterium]
MAREATVEARRFGRSAGMLSLGVGSAGVLTYVYFSLASHNLDRTQYGEVVVLWSTVFILISVLFRPVEQLLSRTIAERQAHGQPIGEALRVAATIQAGLAAAFAVAALALRGPIQDDLLSGNATLYWILVTAVLAFAASFFARGFLAGNRRFALYGALLLMESTARMSFALAVALGIASGQTAVALGVMAAPILSLTVVPLAFAGRAMRSRAAPAAAASDERSKFTLAHGGGFAAAVLLVMVSEQTLLNAGPLLVRASEGAAAAGYIFNVLMIARAPLVLFQAVATSLLPHLTRLRSSTRAGDADAFSLSVRLTLTAIAGFAGLVGVVVAVAGPEIMQLAFGDKFTYDRAGLLIVTVGMGFYLSSGTLNQAALAQGQARRAAACWVSAASAFLIWNLLPVLTEFRRVEVGFAAAAALLCGLLYLLYRSPRTRREDVPAPGSPEEIEARLAAADEAS